MSKGQFLYKAFQKKFESHRAKKISKQFVAEKLYCTQREKNTTTIQLSFQIQAQVQKGISQRIFKSYTSLRSLFFILDI